MATIEKLIKAFEALKVFQGATSTVEEVVKKKDQPLSKKDKIANCNLIADCICAPNMRTVSDFPNFLGVAMETFLALCDDPESDIRMVADECLNRSIKTLLETNLGRLQVELYKEIKKNGSPRCLRAALSRFAEMAHLIRPQKCRPFIVNLIPCLTKICRREDEGIQETLLLSMMKICPALMVFATELEVKMLIKSFLPNLKSPMASCRRAAATCLTIICQHSRTPQTFVNFLLDTLIDSILPVDSEVDSLLLVGVIMSLRSLIPIVSEQSLDLQSRKESLGEKKGQASCAVSVEQLIAVYQLLVFHLNHSDHNVVTSCLEALQQLLRSPPSQLLPVLTSPDAITRTFIYASDRPNSRTNALSEIPSSSDLAPASEDSALEEESESCDIRSQSDGAVRLPVQSESRLADGSKISGAQGSKTLETDKDTDQGLTMSCDSEYSSVEIGDINEDRSEQSNLSSVNAGSQETLLSVKSLSPTHTDSGVPVVGQDMNGNPEILETPPAPLEISDERLLEKLGPQTEGLPILYCVRLLCGRFLLTGRKGELLSDRRVRVSIKSLAMGCVASAVKLYPAVFTEKLFFTERGCEDVSCIRDVLLYASHPDPQLKGMTSQIIGNFISAALNEGRGSFDKWLKDHTDIKQGVWSLSELLEPLLCITEDSSSVAARLAVGSLATIVPQLLHSYHGNIAVQAMLQLLTVKDNSYWLVKVEMLELVQSLDFKVIQHLENTQPLAQQRYAQPVVHQGYLGGLEFQRHILEDLVWPFLGDEDMRVRKAAAQTVVVLIQKLFYPVDYPHQDPVIAVARDNTNHFLWPIMHKWCLRPPPSVQGLVEPYHVTPGQVVQSSVESVLSRIVMHLLQMLNLATSKHERAGCIQCLCMLSEGYATSLYPHAWGCAVPKPLGQRAPNAGYRRPPSRTLSTSSTFSLEELTGSSGGGLLPTLLALLTSTGVTLDLTSHQQALQLAGNLIAGSAYRCLRSHDSDSKADSQSEEGVWPALSNRLLVPLVDQLLTHVARVLNAFSHVIEDQSPGPTQVKSGLPSLPTGPNLSPIKRKNKTEKESGSAPSTPGTDTKANPKSAQKEKEKDSDKDRSKKEGLGTFYILPHFVKFYDALKGAYSNYKISLDLSSSDKFCQLLKTSLSVLSQILEVATLSDVGKHAEEFLNYLKASISLEPTDTILCVQQLLKALFGTNLCSQWEDNQLLSGPLGRSPGQGGAHEGLYQCTFTHPYSQFTQSLAAATIKAVSPDYEDTTGMLMWLKKCVERKVPAILKPSSKADKTAIAAYIRLFEPLVIKALKQYTVTSSLPLQQQVLDLLAQLVQLRVNYCLLDSDQVFIGFVLKQFEFIEEGQIRKSDTLIPNVFNFLVLLSYEKFHSKPVITMPKIIQLCDGIMASGLDPTTHAIPALQPIVHDLFLLRGASKSDISKELETQREVIVSMLLRLINFHQAVDMFVIVLQQCHREHEDRWKRLSRQVTDALLPALAKQQIDLPNQMALDAVHRLFESVAPIVFRPVDILLKALLMKPVNITSKSGLELWMCLVLAVLRVLMAQTKEEVVLSRIHELSLQLHVLKVTETGLSERDRTLVAALKPEEIMARILLQMIGLCVTMINDLTVKNRSCEQSCDFLCQQLSHLLMYITHMFQSGTFRRVASASIQCTQQPAQPFFYSIKEINDNFLLLGNGQPTLTLQWCNVLILLNFSDQSFWSEVVKTPRKYVMASSASDSQEQTDDASSQSASRAQQRCNDEILRRGGLILFCDYACENLNDSEHLTWVLINHVRDLIELSEEPPIQDFISAIHRNSAASSLFIQAIHARWGDVRHPSLVQKTLKCLDAIHLSQSGALVTLLVDRFLLTHHLSVARTCDSIACRRLEILLSESPQERAQQLPLDDLDKLLTFMQGRRLMRKHARLVSLLVKFRESMANNRPSPLTPEVHQFALGKDLTIDKESYMKLAQSQCLGPSPVDARQCALLLQNLEYADMLTILMTKEFHLSILAECITLGAKLSLQTYCRESEQAAAGRHQGDWKLDPLFQASQLTLMRHINNLINHLPVPHEILNFSDTKDQQMSKKAEKFEDILSDMISLETVFCLASSLKQYLTSLALLPWKPKVPLEFYSDICRFCTFTMECIGWLLGSHSMPSGEQLGTSLQCVNAVLQNRELCAVIGQTDHVTHVCSITSAVHHIVTSLSVLPGQHMCVHIQHEETPAKTQRKNDLDYLTRACDQISELMQFALKDVYGGTKHVNNLTASLVSLLTQAVIGLARLPVLNSFARTPPVVWKMGWIPTPSGEPKTKLPPLPIDLMLDKDVLKEFVLRSSMIGWISRQQFEETWMSLLGVLNPTETDNEISQEEHMERSHCMVLAVRAITAMLVQTMIVPGPGNPTQGVCDIQPRDKPLAFLHTRCGKKLSVIRGIVEQELQRLAHTRSGKLSGSGGTKYMFDANLERDTTHDEYSLGQVSIESIWSVVGILEPNMGETTDSETTDSIESPNRMDTPLSNLGPTLATSPSDSTITRDQSLSEAGLDVHSCLQFLLELYRQWLLPGANNKPSLMLLNEIIKSVVCLSDLFAEREQFDWLLDTLMEVYKVHPTEDELSAQYLVVAVSKAAAVVGMLKDRLPDASTAEKVVKMLDSSLRSTHVPSRVAALHGSLYLLEANIAEVSKSLVPILTDYLLKNIQSQSQLPVSNERLMLTLWATAFYLLENYYMDVRDTEFPAQLLQLSVSVSSSSEESVSTAVYLAILKGLERLLLTDVLTAQDAEVIVKLSVDSLYVSRDRLCLSSPQRALAALGLLFTCMYSGKQYDGYSPRPRDQVAFSMDEPQNLLQDPESLIVAMERVTVLFDRIKKGYPYEARVITQVLPAFLADFFPAQDIMNKVIGEFLSNQQPYPHLIARVVFQVFSNLHEQRQQVLLRDWVMLSLSNFTQRTPVAMAMWSLTCFFISASTNKWLRNLLSYVLSRMGKIDTIDRRLFCLAAKDFYCQLTDDTSRRSFKSTFQTAAASQPELPYSELVDCVNKL